MNEIDKLTEYFKEFPGIGPRQAKRFVYFLLRKNSSYVNELSRLIPQIKSNVKICDTCFRYFPKDKSPSGTCPICLDSNRDDSQLMIISRDSDFEAIHKTGMFDGQYFILGGALPVLEKEPSKFIRINELKRLVENKKENLQEIIIAMNANPEGDHTVDYLKKELEPFGLKISILGRGLSTGSELEYADKDTILNALENRK